MTKLNTDTTAESSNDEMDGSESETEPTIETFSSNTDNLKILKDLDMYTPTISLNCSDGHTIRQMFEFFKAALPCAPLFFTPEGIIIQRSNGNKTLFVSCFISRKNLIEYTFNIQNCSHPQYKQHIINFELTDFNTRVKSLAKKEGIRIRQYAEQPKFVFGQLYGGNKTTSHGVIYFKTQNFENESCEINDDFTRETLPNQVVPLSSFCAVCTSVVRSHFTRAYFYVYPNGVQIAAGNETGSTGLRDGWGDCSDTKIVDGKTVQIRPYVTSVPLSDIKALCKTSNIHGSGIVRIYASRDNLTRLEIPAGCLCEITIILQTNNTTSTAVTKTRRVKNPK